MGHTSSQKWFWSECPRLWIRAIQVSQSAKDKAWEFGELWRKKCTRASYFGEQNHRPRHTEPYIVQRQHGGRLFFFSFLKYLVYITSFYSIMLSESRKGGLIRLAFSVCSFDIFSIAISTRNVLPVVVKFCSHARRKEMIVKNSFICSA